MTDILTTQNEWPTANSKEIMLKNYIACSDNLLDTIHF